MERSYSDEEIGDLQSSVATIINRPATELQLGKLRDLIIDYNKKLREIAEPSDKPASAVHLQVETQEDSLGIGDFVNSPNGDLNKIYSTLVYMQNEVRSIRKFIDDEALPSLNAYGEMCEEEELDEGDGEIMIGKILSFLAKIFECTIFANSVVLNITHQLAALYNKRQPRGQEYYQTTFKHVALFSIFDSLGEAMGCLVRVDSVIADNESLLEHWEMYKRMMQFVKNDKEKYGIADHTERQFRKCLHQLDSSLLSVACFEKCVSQQFEPDITMNKEFQMVYQAYLKFKIDKLTELIDSPTETTERNEVIDLLCLYALYRKLFPKEFDKKMYAAIWGIQRKAPAVVVMNLVVFYPTTFMGQHCPMVKSIKLEPKDINKHVMTYIQQRDEAIPALTQNWMLRLCTWAASMQSSIDMSKHSQILNQRVKLFTEGLFLASQIKTTLQLNIALHLHRNIPFKPRNLPFYSQCIEMLKAIEMCFSKKESIQVLHLPLMIRQVVHNINRYVDTVKTRLGNKAPGRIDAFTGMHLFFDLSRSSMTPKRLDLLKLAIALVEMKGVFKDQERMQVHHDIMRLNMLLNFENLLEKTADCQFLYWSKELIPKFFEHLYTDSSSITRIRFLMPALEDAAGLIDKVIHVDRDPIMKEFLDEMEEYIKGAIITPLSRQIENDLRLHIHTVYIQGIERQNPFEETNLSWYLQLDPLKLRNRSMDIKHQIEDYLEQTFYNMNIMNLSDWETYEEMRSLASQKYKLSLPAVYLPSMNLDQGMDLLEISRKLNTFISRFKHNLHSQFFIEATNESSKYVHSLTIAHINSSLRTHGSGIISTTVNATYRLLVKKFTTFSQFLYDDQIMSQILIEKKFFAQNKDSLAQMYPYDRAEEFNKKIKRLGVFEDGGTYLDKFRTLVTQIGNMLGLIRMIKSAGLRYASTISNFIPNTQDIKKFTEISEDYSAFTKESAGVFDKIMEGVTKNYTDDTDYFSLLVNTFKGVVGNSETKHLHNFYMIIPALTLNFADSLLIAKDKINKKNVAGMYFTDDGFSLGIAYVLRVLDQVNEFESLHWFEGVAHRFKKEEKKLEATTKKHEEQKMQQISLRKINDYRFEFNALHWAFNASRIFFDEIKSDGIKSDEIK